MLNEHVWCYFKCNFDGRKFNSNQNLNKELSSCECKNLIKHYTCEKKLFETLVRVLTRLINMWQSHRQGVKWHNNFNENLPF